MSALDWITKRDRPQPKEQAAKKRSKLPPRLAVVREVTPDNVVRHQVVSNVGSENS